MQIKTIAYALLIAGTAAIVAVGTASPSFAAKKKAKAAEETVSPWCYQVQKAVCATRGGMKMTYASACFAQKDGATVVSDGACGAKKMSMKKHGKKSKKM
jgi:hypothetical protein